MHLKDYSAVFFDAGNTLLHLHKPVYEFYSEVAGRHGLSADPLRVRSAFNQAWAEKDNLGSEAGTDEKEWWKSLVRLVFRDIGEFRDFEAFFEELYLLFGKNDLWHLFPEVNEVLSSLRELPLKLAIVSNWDSRLSGIIDYLGLTRYFDGIYLSALVGYAKPDPRIFELALKDLKLTPGKTLHIGDSFLDDVRGARRAGITPVYLNREGRQREGVRTICSLRDLLERGPGLS